MLRNGASTRIRFVLIASVLVCSYLNSSVSAQQLYSWRDKAGRLHYSDAPPPDVNAKPVKGTATPPPPTLSSEPNNSSDKPAGKTLAEQELEFRQRRAQAAENEAKEQQAKAEKERQAANCQTMRSYLKSYESGPITRPNAKGEREFLKDDERNKVIAEQRERIQNECKGM